MKYQKGQSGNPAGRPKGAVNKASKDLRKSVTAFLQDNWEKVQRDFDKLDPKDRLQFYEKMMQYGLPKLQSIEYVSDVEKAIDSMGDDQLDYVVNEILAKNGG